MDAKTRVMRKINEETKKSLKTDLEILQIENSELRNKIEKLELEINNERALTHQKNIYFQNKNTKFEEKIKELESKIDDLEEERVICDFESNCLEDEVLQLESKVAELEEDE